jgi:hypothetical protein
MTLRVLPPPAAPASPVPVERFFVIQKVKSEEWGKSGWEVWLWEGGDRFSVTVRHNLGDFDWRRHKTRREAVEFAKGFAESRGFPFEERPAPTGVPPPDPTDEDKRQAEQQVLVRRIAFFDGVALRHMAESPRAQAQFDGLPAPMDRLPPFGEEPLAAAADCWMKAAKGCRDMIRLQPGRAKYLNMVTAKRIDLAINCLELLRNEVDGSLPTSGLKLIPTPPAPDALAGEEPRP